MTFGINVDRIMPLVPTVLRDGHDKLSQGATLSAYHCSDNAVSEYLVDLFRVMQTAFSSYRPFNPGGVLVLSSVIV